MSFSLNGCRKWGVGFFVAISILSGVSAGETLLLKEVGKFSAGKAGDLFPTGWKALTFKKIKNRTEYDLVKDGDTLVVRARSKASSSGLLRKIKIDPNEYPVIEWRWKVSNIFNKGDVTRKDGDDYPARIYITFEYDPGRVGFWEKAKFKMARLFYGEYPPTGAINYIWANKAGPGKIFRNPYTERVMMVVVESGPELLNTWVNEERNILQDYRKAFGENPPMISGVAIMTDSDNTGESATAYYGDIIFKKLAD